MSKVAVVFHSGYGHTLRIAQAVAEGAGAQLVAIDAEGNLLRRPLMPDTAIISNAFAPVLSAQLTVAPTGRPEIDQ